MNKIRELYINCISPEELAVPTHIEYQEKLRQVRFLEMQLTERLNQEEMQMFEEFMYAKLDCENDKINEAFVDVYKTGSLLMMDILL